MPFLYSTENPMDSEASKALKSEFPFRKFDPSSVIIFDPPSIVSTATSKASTRASHIDALEANFHACVRVGRLARAQVLLLQMQKDHSASHSQLLCAHNTFIKALITRLSHQAVTDMELVFKWYESKMKAADFEGDATTFALMLKSCVQMADEEEAAEKATKIVQEWKDRGLPIERVLESSDLTNSEVVRISQVGKSAKCTGCG
jgi:DNA-directed RNA polymerase, mitochondrial